jgi:signal transduction histidine kinase
LDPKGQILASSHPEHAERLGQPLDHPNLTNILAGEYRVQMNYNRQLQAEIVDIFMPVLGPSRQVVGVVRLTQQLGSVNELFLNLRYLIATAVAVELLVGVGLGLVLALNLERYLGRVTEALYQIASGQPLSPLPERGPAEVRALFQAINTLVERLQSLEEARRHLLANLVHELGRPLGALRATTHALLKGADQDAALRRELIEGIDAEIQRLQPLLDNLTQLHGQVLGTLELHRQPTEIGPWLSRTLQPWQAMAQEKGQQWVVEMPGTLPALNIDINQLAQAIGNLLSNAIKYTPSDGAITIEAGVKDDTLQICVRDTGPGITAEEQEHIFDPFYRSQPNRRFPQGMGLGLTIARDMVVAHGGQLLVESTPGLGSHFTIRLPLSPEW